MKRDEHARADHDSRFTVGLHVDVEEVLRKHGYQKHPDVRVNAELLVLLLRLVEAFEGRSTERVAP